MGMRSGWVRVGVVGVLAGCACGGKEQVGGVGERAREALVGGRPQEARELLEGLGSRTAAEDVVLAEAFLAQGEPEAAARCFHRALEGDGESEVRYAALSGLGDIALNRRDAYVARERFREAQGVAGTREARDRALVGEARAELIAGHREEARACRERVSGTDVPGLRDLDSMLARLVADPLEEERPVADLVRPADVHRPAVRRPAPEVIGRSAWRASPARASGGPLPMGRINRITLHHTAIRAGPTSVEGTAAHLRSLQSDHQDSRGWADLGYHYVIDRMGRVWEGRELALQGAHAGSGEANAGNLGIVLLGHFDLESPTAAQQATLAQLVRWAAAEHTIGPMAIAGHDDVRRVYLGTGTACPGRELAALIPELRRLVRKDQAAARSVTPR
jgi:tetratricopeptide (TPR) repeat protein